jgi:predicted alpha/beta hydrolase family esterase
MTSVLYFHGFASSPASAKITALRPLLAPHGIELNTPDLNVPSFESLDWNAMVARALDAAREHPPRAVVGSSLGSLVALEIVRRGVIAPVVLIAPALGIADRWKTKLPDGDPIVVFNHARGANAPIHRAFFEQMFEVRIDDDPPPVRVVAIMGTDDDTVPFDLVQKTWRRWESRGLAAGSKFITIDRGDHGLTAYADVIEREVIRVIPSER